jgi:hypothetical protein
MDQNNRNTRTGSSARWLVGLVLFLAVAGFLLLSEHRAHGFYLLLWLLILSCPLLHFWMHGGHGSHDKNTPETPAPRKRDRGTHQH